ncbi:MAG: hypothetical protein LC774_16260 [Acidobacteria bacterium]|nr:hypothetical protein [Acidobacteriota bacterium]
MADADERSRIRTQYFRAQVLKHSMARYLPIWQQPPPKESIRVSFLREAE